MSAASDERSDQSNQNMPVQPLAYAELDSSVKPSARPAAHTATNVADNSNPLHGVRALVTVCIGNAELTVGELLNAKEQQVVRLDRKLDEPVDLVLQGQVIARGHLVAVGDQFGIRITELPQILAP